MCSQIETGAACKTELSAYAKMQRWVDTNLAAQNEPPALSLDERGMIQDCNPRIESLFGFQRSDLVWHHISMLFPQLTGVELVQSGKFNPSLSYLCRCGHCFKGLKRQGDVFSSNLSIAYIGYDGSRSLRIFVHPSAELAAA
ncbi:MAG: PAS domain-containing protein [Sideroxyarcus sp.]|nr:PAS domain-containing protein [Sideroxyarcus sp.]